ncbi:Cytochrome P450 [Aspergillus parasiticus SU-1]|uniref:Cytochrome P450 n=1 Tax=Aspergillus parasiticus (strain ATCC 56775 / NRRL 5862 / SRRC 143 / SU-1) TaxID=1403190 RepID=A0A0F0HXW0_ASPPU|nr:Cytochrome P450 [Aspergillus parasiticus SU-1]
MTTLVLDSTHDMMHSWLAILTLPIAWGLWRIVYRLWLHPLSGYPGPRLAAVSNLPYFAWTCTGNLHLRLQELHEVYGDVIRIRPNALTYRTPEAWTDIYGHRKPGTLPFSKDPEFFMPAQAGSSHMINANEKDHTRQKRLLNHAFSERSLRQQEHLIMGYIDLFIQRLQEQARGGAESVNMEEWLNFLTFDIIGDLAFGEPFGCLQNSEYHPWVATIFKSIKTGAILRALNIYPILLGLIRRFLPKSLVQKRIAHYQMSKDRVTRRLRTETSRPDFISYILKYNDDRGMSTSEIEMNAALIIQAGSETTATVLAACLYFLQKNSACYRRLVQDIRSTFTQEADINFLSVAQLPYLNGVIEESLRLFPPAPGIGPRVVPEGGARICGRYVPGGVSVSVGHYSTFRSAWNFTRPNEFLPQRWLDRDADSEFASDQTMALQPFSYGPRACIGRNLAYAEMRTILAKILWHFDVQLDERSADWANSKSYIVWEKGPLWLKLHPRECTTRD